MSEPALLDEIVLILQELHRREALDTTLAVAELIHTATSVVSLPTYVMAYEHHCVRTFGHILPGHVRVVFALPCADQLLFLRQAEKRKRSVRRLKDEVSNHGRSQGERQGRPSNAPQDKVAARLSQHLSALNDAVDHALKTPSTPALRDAFQQAVNAKALGGKAALWARRTSVEPRAPTFRHVPDLRAA